MPDAEGGDAVGFSAPDAVFVSVGDGCIIGGVYKGFFDLIQLGWIDQMPRIIGVQSDRSAALYNAWRQDGMYLSRWTRRRGRTASA